jgi:hypothetical protein
MDICKIEHPKTKNAYKSSIEPFTKAFDNYKNYFNDKFKKYYKYKQDMVSIVLCHSLKCLWISINYGYSIEEDEKLNNNHVLLHELPDDIMKKISNNLLDKNNKRFNTIFNDSNDYKSLKILFGNNIPSRKPLKYIEPNVFNEYKIILI